MLGRVRRCATPLEQSLCQYVHSRNHIVRAMSSTPTTLPTQRPDLESKKLSALQQYIPPGMSELEYASSIEHGRSLRPSYQHPRTHNIPVALIHFRSHYPHLLELATHFATHAAAALAIPCSKPAYLPTQRSLWTVLRGPFAHKKSQENFERRVHKRAIKAWDADNQAVERWLTYLQLHPVEGVGMRVVRWHRAPVGIGKTHEPSESMVLENVTDKQKVEELAKKIVEKEMAAAGLSSIEKAS